MFTSKTMRNVAICCVFSILVLIATPSPGVADGFYSYAFAKVYESTIDEDLLAHYPKWKSDAATPPAVVPRRVIASAEQTAERLVKAKKGWKRCLRDVSLMQAFDEEGYWYWCAHFEWERPGGGRPFIPPRLKVFVMPDGKVVEPRVFKEIHPSDDSNREQATAKKTATAASEPLSTAKETHDGTVYDRRCKFEITADMLRRSPDWPVSSDWPTLSPRRAIEIATLIADIELATQFALEEIDGRPHRRRSLRAVSLVPSSVVKGKWYWRVDYQWRITQGAFDGPPLRLNVYILMDGTVVKPTFTR